MTNDEIRSLRPGDIFEETINGRVTRHCPCYVGKPIKCDYDRAGAYGHYAITVETPSGTGNGWFSWTIQSDEYTAGSGYVTHQDGVRIRGCELIHRATDKQNAAASELCSSSRKDK